MNLCLDNIVFSLQRAGGISVYWSELLSRLIRDDRGVFTVEAAAADQNIFRAKLHLASSRITQETRDVRIGRYLRAPVIDQRCDLFHSSYYRLPSSRDMLHVQSCYDFTYERFRGGPARWAHSWQKGQAMSSAHGVICISESTRRDLLHFCPQVHPENTAVIHLGYSDSFKPISDYEASNLLKSHIDPKAPFSVYVGDRSAYKNFSVAVDAVAQRLDHTLVVVGGGPLKQTDLAYLERRLAGRWAHIDRVPSTVLNGIYNLAHALIYPSSYEGFGIPVIEAMAAGCPVIAVNVSSIPEAAGDAGLLLDRPDADGVVHQLKLLEDGSFRADVRAKSLENASRFSWERCYQETLNFYTRVLGQWSSS